MSAHGMEDPLASLLNGHLDPAGQLGIDGSLECRRVWPTGENGWTALLGPKDLPPAKTWALLKPGKTRRGTVRRLLRHGTSRWLLDQEVAAWQLESEAVVAERGDWLDPAGLGLPRGLARGRVVSYKPLRRVVTSFAGKHDRPRYFAKHLRPESARRSADNHLLIASWWADVPELTLPGLLRAEVAPGFLIWEAAHGTPLARTSGGRELASFVRAAGHCLASLHGCPATHPQRRTREAELQTIAAWLRVMRPGIESLGDFAHGLAALAESARRLSRARFVISHCDFHDGQILVDNQRTTLLDLDTLAMAEPELDVGNFLAHLDLFTFERPDLSAGDLEGLALESYAAGRGPLLSTARLDWYRAASTLRLACVHASRPESRHLLPQLTKRAMQLTGELWVPQQEAV